MLRLALIIPLALMPLSAWAQYQDTYNPHAPASAANPTPVAPIGPAGQPAGSAASPLVIAPLPPACPSNPLSRKIPPLC